MEQRIRIIFQTSNAIRESLPEQAVEREFGPFEWLQWTFESVYAGSGHPRIAEQTLVASFDRYGYWVLELPDCQGEIYSDVVVLPALAEVSL